MIFKGHNALCNANCAVLWLNSWLRRRARRWQATDGQSDDALSIIIKSLYLQRFGRNFECNFVSILPILCQVER